MEVRIDIHFSRLRELRLCTFTDGAVHTCRYIRTPHLFSEERLGSLFCDSCAKHPVSFQHGSSLMPKWLRGYETNTLFIKKRHSRRKTTHKDLAPKSESRQSYTHSCCSHASHYTRFTLRPKLVCSTGAGLGVNVISSLWIFLFDLSETDRHFLDVQQRM